MNIQRRKEYGKSLRTRLTNEKSASDYRIPPTDEVWLDEATDTLVSHYISANTALIEENMKLKNENEYLQLVLGELRKNINNLDKLV
jgi:hypothetical protein